MVEIAKEFEFIFRSVFIQLEFALILLFDIWWIQQNVKSKNKTH